MNVNDKIKQILIDKSISPSVFADEIGVQRSSISHILSGRNRPSFDIIQKIIRRFPDLGYEWILEEESPSPVQAKPNSRLETYPELIPEVSTSRHLRTTPRTEIESPELKNGQPTLTASATESQKTVERILIFYSDGTFKEYIPA